MPSKAYIHDEEVAKLRSTERWGHLPFYFLMTCPPNDVVGYSGTVVRLE